MNLITIQELIESGKLSVGSFIDYPPNGISDAELWEIRLSLTYENTGFLKPQHPTVERFSWMYTGIRKEDKGIMLISERSTSYSIAFSEKYGLDRLKTVLDSIAVKYYSCPLIGAKAEALSKELYTKLWHELPDDLKLKLLSANVKEKTRKYLLTTEGIYTVNHSYYAIYAEESNDGTMDISSKFVYDEITHDRDIFSGAFKIVVWLKPDTKLYIQDDFDGSSKKKAIKIYSPKTF